MTRNLRLLLAAVAVLAFAVPSMANAAEATVPAGTRAAVGTIFTMTGKHFTLKSSIVGDTGCEFLNLNFTLTKNDGSTVEGSGSNTSPTQAGCKNGQEQITVTKVNITNLTAKELGTGSIKTGTMSFTMEWDFPRFKCNYTGTNIPFSYTRGSDVIKFFEATTVTGGACGNAKLSAEFTLEKSGTTTAVILD